MKLSWCGLPEGFCVNSEERVVWATGDRYIRDGTNPDRVETIALLGHHGLCLTWEGPRSLRAATPDEARAWVQKVRKHIDSVKAALVAECDAQCRSYESEAAKFERALLAP